MSHPCPPALAGLILAGGRSSRFGAPKAAALLDGRSLLQIAAEALAPYCAAVAVSAPAQSVAADLARGLGLPVLPDEPGHAAGPLAGVSAGLAWARAGGLGALAVRPVDTPRLPPEIHARLAGAIGDAPAAYCLTIDGPQPLCALWTLGAEAALREALEGGRHPSAHRFLDAIGAARLAVEDPAAFANINTPADLRALGWTAGE